MLDDVKELHRKFGLPIHSQPFGNNARKFRTGFLDEELRELFEAKTIEEVVDALVDLAYVAAGTILYLPEEPYWAYYKSDRITKSDAYNYLIRSNWKELFKRDIAIVRTGSNMDVFISCMNIMGNCYFVLYLLGFDFKKHWNEVHDANMAKELSSAENPSSRGNTSGDLFKPEGWKAPDHRSIIDDRT